jgi:hypothetical protein
MPDVNAHSTNYMSALSEHTNILRYVITENYSHLCEPNDLNTVIVKTRYKFFYEEIIKKNKSFITDVFTRELI